MTTPLGGILVAGLYLAFTAILWISLSLRIRRQTASPTTQAAQESAGAPANTAANPAPPPGGTPTAPDALRPALFLFWIAALAHVAAISLDLTYTFPDASLSKTFSLTTLLMTISLLCLCVRYRLQILLLFFGPLTATAVLISAFDRETTAPFATDALTYWHLIAGLVGATISLLTLPLAFVAQTVNRRLHQGSDTVWFGYLPPLESIEKLIVRLIAAATAFLGLAIVLIIPNITDVMEQHLAHKIFFSAFAVLILLALLTGHWLYGWRGKHLVWLVYGANACLILAYFGTKVALELVLQY